jgi:rhomboid protease GluP
MTMTGPLDAPQARAILERADQLAASGDYDAASRTYARVVGNGDAQIHTAALLGLADSRYRLNDEEGALQSWIVATQAPENPLTWRAWVNLAGARVRQGDNNGAMRAYREAERRAPPEERPAIASRLGWLSKETGNSGQAQRYFGRARTGVFTPIATYGLIGVTSAISLFVLVSSPEVGDALALDKIAVLGGEWWRLLTAVFVHGSILHLIFNMYALFIVGPIVEAMYGRPLYLTFYLLCGLAGSIASFLFLANPSVGASGAIFGMFGLLAVSTYVHKPALGRQARALTGQIVMLIVINLVIGFGVGGVFGAQIDNAAHIGGLIAGAWLGLTVVPRGMSTLASFWSTPESGSAPGADPRLRALIQLGAIVAVLVVVVVGLSITPFWVGSLR